MNLKLKTLAAAVIPALGIGIAGAGMDLANQSHGLIGAQSSVAATSSAGTDTSIVTSTGLGAPAEITLRPDSRMNKLIGARVSDERGRNLGKVTSVSVAQTMTGSQVFARVEPGAGIDAQIVALGQPDTVAALVNTPVRDADNPIDVVVNRSNGDTDILTPQSRGQ